MLQPNNSRSLSLLGDAQLRYYDNDPDSKGVLQESEDSYRTSIDLEGKPSGGNVLPDKIREQKWYKDRQAKIEADKKATTTPQKATAGPAKPAGRGAATPTRGGPAVRGGGAATRGRGAAATGKRLVNKHCTGYMLFIMLSYKHQED